MFGHFLVLCILLTVSHLMEPRRLLYITYQSEYELKGKDMGLLLCVYKTCGTIYTITL